jgi:putative heme-binding domain-containing protein
VPTDTARGRTAAAEFALRGLAWSLCLFGLSRLNWTEAHVVSPLTQLQAGVAAGLLGVPSLSVEVTLACSGADALAMCLGAVLAYPVPWRQRLYGVAGGGAVILALNTVRIGTLGRVAASPAWFNPLHVYVWPVVLTFAIAAYVFAWMRFADRRQALAENVRGDAASSGRRPRPTSRFIGLTATFFLVFSAAAPLYLGSPTVLALAGLIARAAAAILTSIGASAPVDYLVESVLAPNRKVKEGFNSVQVTTRDGQELSGILVRETGQELILRDATNREISIPKQNIESRKIGGSLMPAALVDILSDGERLDLFRFLSELGKPGAFDATKGNVARVWRLNTSSDSPEQIVKSDLSQWPVFYATAGGALLKGELQNELASPTRREPFFAAARFQVPKAGLVKLKLSGVESPKAWLDGKPVGGSAEMAADLSAGTHTIIVKLDPQQLPDQIRLETTEGSFLIE